VVSITIRIIIRDHFTGFHLARKKGTLAIALVQPHSVRRCADNWGADNWGHSKITLSEITGDIQRSRWRAALCLCWRTEAFHLHFPSYTQDFPQACAPPRSARSRLCSDPSFALLSRTRPPMSWETRRQNDPYGTSSGPVHARVVRERLGRGLQVEADGESHRARFSSIRRLPAWKQASCGSAGKRVKVVVVPTGTVGVRLETIAVQLWTIATPSGATRRPYRSTSPVDRPQAAAVSPAHPPRPVATLRAEFDPHPCQTATTCGMLIPAASHRMFGPTSGSRTVKG
jgi:hypothetical protein